MKLFILGNGFDLKHEFKTHYNDFKVFLEEEYTGATYGYLPESRLMPGGDFGYSEAECAGFIVNEISQVEGDWWRDVESSLARLNFDHFEDIEERENPFHAAYNNEDNSNAIHESFSKISGFFNEWVSKIDIDAGGVNENFSALIDKNNDLFLTFNYTLTLENLYSAKNVCHIHGKQNDEFLYFGHGGEQVVYDEDGDYDCPYGKRMYFGAELTGLYSELRKDTSDAMRNNRQFFEQLRYSAIKEIRSYGFSFSDVDLVYIKEICRLLDTRNIVWFLQQDKYVSVEENEHRKELIRGCGFIGEFDHFEI